MGLALSFIILAYYVKTYFEISTFAAAIEPVLPRIAITIMALFMVNVFLKISIPIIKKSIFNHAKAEEWKMIRSLYVVIIWLITLLIILSGIFGSFSSLGVSLSLIGAGVAFALQHVILSFAGWFLIILRHPYKIGDRIYIKSSDIRGDVEDITMLFTVLKEVATDEAVTGKNIILPNSTVFLEPIVNYTFDVPQIWLSLPIYITYESDLQLAEKIIFEAARHVAGEEMKKAASMIRQKTPDSVQLEFAREEPVLRVEFADSSIIIRVRIMCRPKQVTAIRSEIYKRVLDEFNGIENKDKVEIAYPHMELVFHDEVMSERMKRYLDRRPRD